jgi:hypothetical protein
LLFGNMADGTIGFRNRSMLMFMLMGMGSCRQQKKYKRDKGEPSGQPGAAGGDSGMMLGTNGFSDGRHGEYF